MYSRRFWIFTAAAAAASADVFRFGFLALKFLSFGCDSNCWWFDVNRTSRDRRSNKNVSSIFYFEEHVMKFRLFVFLFLFLLHIKNKETQELCVCVCHLMHTEVLLLFFSARLFNLFSYYTSSLRLEANSGFPLKVFAIRKHLSIQQTSWIIWFFLFIILVRPFIKEKEAIWNTGCNFPKSDKSLMFLHPPTYVPQRIRG